jgi:uncharacterized protein YbaP (TraB family)
MIDFTFSAETVASGLDLGLDSYGSSTKGPAKRGLTKGQNRKIVTTLKGANRATSKPETCMPTNTQIFTFSESYHLEGLKKELQDKGLLKFEDIKRYRSAFKENIQQELSYAQVLSCCPNLWALDLSGSEIDDEALAEILDAAKECPLKVLNISSCKKITKVNVEAMSHLERLKLDFCEELTEVHSKGVALTALETKGCVKLKVPVKGHFYEIRDVEGKLRGYLLGTMHLMHRNLMHMNEKILKAMAEADRLFVEITSSPQSSRKPSEEEINESLKLYASILSTHPLKDTTWEKLQEKMALLGPMQALELCVQEYQYVRAHKNGSVDSSNVAFSTIDGWLVHQFSKNEKSVLNLETEETRLKQASKEVVDSVYEEYLKGILEPDLERDAQQALKGAQFWGSGEIAWRPNEKGTKQYQKSEKRSKHMGKVIHEDLMKDEKIGFYACGSAHLYDGKGVIQHLRNQGLTVTRIE